MILKISYFSGRKSFGNKALEWLPTIAVGAAVGVAGTVAAPVVASAVLGAAGFTTSGVAAGSAAAAIQSTFYGGYVASGSTFALLQSAGAAGISATTSGVIGGSSGVAAAIGTKWFQNVGFSHLFKPECLTIKLGSKFPSLIFTTYSRISSNDHLFKGSKLFQT